MKRETRQEQKHELNCAFQKIRLDEDWQAFSFFLLFNSIRKRIINTGDMCIPCTHFNELT